jgi:hypothetical protein
VGKKPSEGAGIVPLPKAFSSIDSSCEGAMFLLRSRVAQAMESSLAGG